MRYSSAAGVHADEVRVKGMHHLPGHDASYHKEAGVLFIGEFMPPGNMPLGNYKAMPFAQWIDVQDTDRQIVFVDLVGFSSPCHNVAKYTGILGFFWHNYDRVAPIENSGDYFNKEAFQEAAVV